jgi:chromate transporter
LWVISLATLMAGVPGALLATLAAVLPPVLVLVVQRVYRRVADLPAAQGFLDGLMLAIIGVGLVVLTELFIGAGLNAGVIGIAALSLIAALTRRVPAFVIIFLAALAGIALGWIG